MRVLGINYTVNNCLFSGGNNGCPIYRSTALGSSRTANGSIASFGNMSMDMIVMGKKSLYTFFKVSV